MRVLAVVGVLLGQRLPRLALAVLLVVAVPDGLVAPRAGVGTAAAVGRVHHGAIRVLVAGAAGHELERLPVGA